MFKEKFPTNDQEKKEGEMGIKELKGDFFQALENEDLAKAFEALNDIYEMLPENPKQEDWFDHQSRSLFQEFYKKSDWKSAKAVIEITTKPGSKEGRIKRLEELSGQSYEEI